MPRFAATALLAVAALAACQQAESPEQMHARMQMESDSARIAIEARAAGFTEAYNAGDADAAAAFYASDAVLMPPGMPAVTGRDAIRTFMAGLASGGMPPGSRFSLRVLDVMANGPLAIDRGQWTFTIPAPDGSTSEVRGKYLAVWHRVDGEWVMASDIWNGDAPDPPTEPTGN